MRLGLQLGYSRLGDGGEGFAHAVEEIAVPDRLVRSTALVGRPAELRDRVAELAAAGVTTLLVSPLAATRAERVKDIADLKHVPVDAPL